ncbi:MAG: potassium transporter KtrB [Clostridia bacterium]|nr:potassium transporter KtrB [Clostridia bacterium]
MKRKTRFSFSTTHLIMLSFLCVVAVGSLLLWLPISSKSGQSVAFVDALFTATTATCVTGLVTLPTHATWSVFGQIVILLLIQIGGLGLITIMGAFSLMLHRKMGLGDRMLLRDAFNLNTLWEIGPFVRRVVLGTLAVEGVGALLYMLVFVPEYGWHGIWLSVFTAVSAFCNAGIDLFGDVSLSAYATHPLVNAITMALIVIGGIGFVVWWDVLGIIKLIGKRRQPLAHLTLQSKIVLTSTAILLTLGCAAFLAFEWHNPATLGGHSLFDKVQMALFQSVTTRTAGFFTIPQEALTTPSALVSLMLMFIGGSPVGTAGGIKTVTFALLVAKAASAVHGQQRVSLFGRTVRNEAIGKAVAVCMTSFCIMALATLGLTLVSDASVIDILYETVSATATVGLTRALTPTLDTVGKLIVIVTMYLGRVGPISLAVAFTVGASKQNLIENPTEDVSVG